MISVFLWYLAVVKLPEPIELMSLRREQVGVCC